VPVRGDEDNICIGTDLATHIADDLNLLAPQGWVYWTAMENAPDGWGLLTDSAYPHEGDVGSVVTPSARFWALGQYTRFITPGSTIIPVANETRGTTIVVSKLAAGGVVVVATNPDITASPLDIELNPIAAQDTTVAVYRTTASEHQALLSTPTAQLRSGVLSDELPGQSISTYILHSTSSSGPHTTTADGITFRDAGLPFPGIGAAYTTFAAAHRPPTDETSPGPYCAFDSVGYLRDTFADVNGNPLGTLCEADAHTYITAFTLFFPRRISLDVAKKLVAAQLPPDAVATGSRRQYYLGNEYNYPEGDCVTYSSVSLSHRLGTDGQIDAFYGSGTELYVRIPNEHYSPAQVSYATLDAPSAGGPPCNYAG
jgi:hypothetical protein